MITWIDVAFFAVAALFMLGVIWLGLKYGSKND